MARMTYCTDFGDGTLAPIIFSRFKVRPEAPWMHPRASEMIQDEGVVHGS